MSSRLFLATSQKSSRVLAAEGFEADYGAFEGYGQTIEAD